MKKALIAIAIATGLGLVVSPTAKDPGGVLSHPKTNVVAKDPGGVLETGVTTPFAKDPGGVL